jgi:hypothetical protein
MIVHHQRQSSGPEVASSSPKKVLYNMPWNQSKCTWKAPACAAQLLCSDSIATLAVLCIALLVANAAAAGTGPACCTTAWPSALRWLRFCCKESSYVLAGDTAQTIARGCIRFSLMA